MAQKKQSGRSTSSKRTANAGKTAKGRTDKSTAPKQTKRTNARKPAEGAAKKRADKSTKRKTNGSSKTNKQLATVRTSRENADGRNTQSRARVAAQSDFTGMTSITVNDHTITVNGSKKFTRTDANVEAAQRAMAKRQMKSFTVRY